AKLYYLRALRGKAARLREAEKEGGFGSAGDRSHNRSLAFGISVQLVAHFAFVASVANVDRAGLHKNLLRLRLSPICTKLLLSCRRNRNSASSNLILRFPAPRPSCAC